MFINKNNNILDEEDNMFIWNEDEFSLSEAICPDDIPLIEVDDEQDLHFSDGMFHIEDL